MWLKVDDDVKFVQDLMQEKSVLALPGEFMAVKTDNGNPGSGFVRMALVHDLEVTEEAMKRVSQLNQKK